MQFAAKQKTMEQKKAEIKALSEKMLQEGKKRERQYKKLEEDLRQVGREQIFQSYLYLARPLKCRRLSTEICGRDQSLIVF